MLDDFVVLYVFSVWYELPVQERLQARPKHHGENRDFSLFCEILEKIVVQKKYAKEKWECQKELLFWLFGSVFYRISLIILIYDFIKFLHLITDGWKKSNGKLRRGFSLNQRIFIYEFDKSHNSFQAKQNHFGAPLILELVLAAC